MSPLAQQLHREFAEAADESILSRTSVPAQSSRSREIPGLVRESDPATRTTVRTRIPRTRV